jgi:predicted O-methyltransferase YrrM
MPEKIKKLIRTMVYLVRKPYLLNLILNSQDVKKESAIKKYNLPNGLPVIDCSSIFPHTVNVEPYAYLNGSCIPTDIALLKSLALKFNADTYFEIGTWRGESVANVASVVPNCVTFNLSGEEIISLGLSKEYAALHGYFSRDLKNVNHLYGNSHTFDFKDHYGRYDLVFIDGDHHYESVRKDTETAFKLIKDSSSIIVWHDYAREPETIRWEVFEGILDGCPANKRDRLFHVSNTLCAVYLNKEIETTELKQYRKPDKYFRISLSLTRE